MLVSIFIENSKLVSSLVEAIHTPLARMDSRRKRLMCDRSDEALWMVATNVGSRPRTLRQGGMGSNVFGESFVSSHACIMRLRNREHGIFLRLCPGGELRGLAVPFLAGRQCDYSHHAPAPVASRGRTGYQRDHVPQARMGVFPTQCNVPIGAPALNVDFGEAFLSEYAQAFSIGFG
jgi:hypothetical protein